MLVFKNNAWCSNHKNRRGEYVCLSDCCQEKKAICTNCASELHQNHLIESISTLGERVASCGDKNVKRLVNSGILDQLHKIERRTQESFLRMQMALSQVQQHFSTSMTQMKQTLMKGSKEQEVLEEIIVKLKKGNTVKQNNLATMLKQLEELSSSPQQREIGIPNIQSLELNQLCDRLETYQIDFSAQLNMLQIFADNLLNIHEFDKPKQNIISLSPPSLISPSLISPQPLVVTADIKSAALPQITLNEVKKLDSMASASAENQSQLLPPPIPISDSQSQSRRSIRSMRSNISSKSKKSNKSQRSHKSQSQKSAQILDLSEGNVVEDLSFDFLDSPISKEDGGLNTFEKLQQQQPEDNKNQMNSGVNVERKEDDDNDDEGEEEDVYVEMKEIQQLVKQ